MIFKKICFKLTAFEEIEKRGKINIVEPRDTSVYIEKQENRSDKEKSIQDTNVIFDGITSKNFKCCTEIDIKINSKSVQVVKASIPINTAINNVIVSLSFT